jgi:hypothetical protein
MTGERLRISNKLLIKRTIKYVNNGVTDKGCKVLSIVSLLFVVTLSILITRVATIAIAYTGLSRESARFQARSALSGAGFTTSESERVVNHPVRRRIILSLMLLGNAGIVGAVSSLILTFVNASDPTAVTLRIVLLVAGLVVLWAVAMSQWVDRRLSRVISWALQKYTRIDVLDYANLMHLAGDYRIVELLVREGDWLAGKTLLETRLREEGVMVLGITREEGTYLGVPIGSTKILPHDTLIAYGRIAALDAIDQRRDDWVGRQDHKAAVQKQRQVVEEEKQEDPAKTNVKIF